MLNFTFQIPEFFVNVNTSRQDTVDLILSGKKPAQTSMSPTDVLWLLLYVLLQHEHWRYIMATPKTTSNKILQTIILSQKTMKQTFWLCEDKIYCLILCYSWKSRLLSYICLTYECIFFRSLSQLRFGAFCDFPVLKLFLIPSSLKWPL